MVSSREQVIMARTHGSALRPRTPDSAVAEAVRAGLSSSPKMLAPWLFYDAVGSALFEQITLLPEYPLTRTEDRILAERANEIMAACECGPEVIELGAGTAQ